ncbi:MAG: acetylornithine transaminase [Janthinobacterium lividum]
MTTTTYAPETSYTLDTGTGQISPVIDDAEIKQLDADYLLPVYARLPVTLVRGQGVKVWDADGKEYIDFLAGIATNALGHCHPKMVAAIQEQAATLIHTSGYYFTAPVAKLAQKLTQVSGMERVFFGNSGAEAVECAIKISRKYAKSHGAPSKFSIVAAQKSFHGRTMATVTATGQPKYQEPFKPMVQGFTHVPFNDIEALKAAVTDDTCAVLLEPIQGEGGVYPAHKPYLEAARALCDEHQALLIFDEVQTGIGRTGKWFAYEHYGVVPDILTSAKALGGGFPIGACLARGEAAATLVAGDHGSTYGGNPLACAAALAVLNTIEEEHLLANAHAMGDYFVHRLNEQPLRDKIADIRALGLMIGVELKAPDAKRVLMEGLEHGLLMSAIGDNTLRFVPPLNITQSDIDAVMDILAVIV